MHGRPCRLNKLTSLGNTQGIIDDSTIDILLVDARETIFDRDDDHTTLIKAPTLTNSLLDLLGSALK